MAVAACSDSTSPSSTPSPTGGSPARAATPLGADGITDLVAAVDSGRLEADVRAMEGPRSSHDGSVNHLEQVRDLVRDRFASLGYAPALDDVTYRGSSFPVIAADLRGARCPDRVFIVSAHYDSVPLAPGADDDASGMAAVLELARVLQGQQLPATVRFTAFPFEEDGVVGSTQTAREDRRQNVPVVGMVSAEMLSYTKAPADDFILIAANEASQPLLDAFLSAHDAYLSALPERHLAVPGTGETIPDVRRSDHGPFWDNGYRALMLTDTANFRNPNYHQPSDTSATLDFAFLSSNTRLLLAGVVTYLQADANGDSTPDVCQG